MRSSVFLLIASLLTFGHPAIAQIGEIDVNAGPPAERPQPKNHSALWLHAKTRVTVMLKDAKGRRTGVDPKTHKVVESIPDSSCQVDFMENPYTGEARYEADQRINLEPAAEGTYELEILGLQPGPYQILVSALANNGSSLPTKEIEGLISEGERKRLQLRFDPSPNSVITVVDTPARR
jgi:hypothetical protein